MNDVIVVQKVKQLLKDIKNNGCTINNTRELQNVLITIKNSEYDYFMESLGVEEWYNKFVGKWDDRMKLEHNHYNFLKAYLVHKIGEVRYFHKEETLTSRKFVVWSQDCIASIQFLHRPHKNSLNIFIRSSDVLNLLPADLFFGLQLLDLLYNEFNIEPNDCDEVNYFITSAHYYLKDVQKINILEDD